MERHIVEMEAIGVKRPSSLPVFYRCSASRLNTADEIEVTGEDSSGEVEFVLIQSEGNLWVGTGSDQTNRKVEVVQHHGVEAHRAALGSNGPAGLDCDRHRVGRTARLLRHFQRHCTGHRRTAPVATVRVRIRRSGVRPVATARVRGTDAAGDWLNQINKARRVLSAGPYFFWALPRTPWVAYGRWSLHEAFRSMARCSASGTSITTKRPAAYR